MKKLQQLCMAAVLALMLGISASAGDIGIGKAPQPPDPSSATAPGEIGMPGDIGMP